MQAFWQSVKDKHAYITDAIAAHPAMTLWGGIVLIVVVAVVL